MSGHVRTILKTAGHTVRALKILILCPVYTCKLFRFDIFVLVGNLWLLHLALPWTLLVPLLDEKYFKIVKRQRVEPLLM